MAMCDAVLCYLASLPPSGLTGVENYASCTTHLTPPSVGMSCSSLQHPCLHVVFRKLPFIHKSKCPWSLFTGPLWISCDIHHIPQIKAVSSLFQLICISFLCWLSRCSLPYRLKLQDHCEHNAEFADIPIVQEFLITNAHWNYPGSSLKSISVHVLPQSMHPKSLWVRPSAQTLIESSWVNLMCCHC